MLANSANVIMVAEHAAEMSEKHVLVVPSASQQAGLAIAVALDPDRGAQENASALRGRSRGCAPGRWPRPPATTARGASGAGEAVGFVGEQIICLGRSRRRPCGRCWRSSSTGAELISVLEGARAPLDRADGHRARRTATGASSSSAPRRPTRLLVAAERPSSAGGSDRRRHAVEE